MKWNMNYCIIDVLDWYKPDFYFYCKTYYTMKKEREMIILVEYIWKKKKKIATHLAKFK